ncbi:hypothetical protein G4B88_028521 [Cannabis sativa]|uniref:Uncharacterized protein n=1 Tax=Cannabis sativa TaxID=3483 RepID=A0A7J6GNI7_CANSA|nr:hypothetical protein G4B88_028521 [Cannabis sativa]
MRTKDKPSVFSPPKLSTFKVVTLDPSGLLVSPGLFSPELKKSFGLVDFGLLQNLPFSTTPSIIESKHMIKD